MSKRRKDDDGLVWIILVILLLIAFGGCSPRTTFECNTNDEGDVEYACPNWGHK